MENSLSSPITVADVLAEGKRLRRRYALSVIGLVAALFLAATVGMSIGAVSVPFGEVWTIIGRHVLQHGVFDARQESLRCYSRFDCA